MLRLVALAGVLLVLALPNPAHAQDGPYPDDVQHVLDALFSGDQDAVKDLVRFTSVECTEEPLGLGAPPECPEGAHEGTLIDAFPSASCEGGYVPAAEIDRVVEILSTPRPELYGVFLNPEPAGGFFYGEYVAVYTGIIAELPQDAGAVYIESGAVTGLFTGCGYDAPAFIAERGLQEFDLEEPTPGALPETGTGSSRSVAVPWTALLAAALAGACASFGAALLRR